MKREKSKEKTKTKTKRFREEEAIRSVKCGGGNGSGRFKGFRFLVWIVERCGGTTLVQSERETIRIG